MAATSSIRIVKKFTYRGAVRNFSSRYHMGTAVPADSAHWTTLADAITAAEKLCYMPFSSGGADIVQAVGYAPGSEVPVFTKNYSLVSTGSFGAGSLTPGDAAALVRYSTPDRSSKNHPVYCFNYYHSIWSSAGSTGQDTVLPAQLSALQTYANGWITGYSDGTTSYKRSRPSGDLCTAALAESLITHRDLPR